MIGQSLFKLIKRDNHRAKIFVLFFISALGIIMIAEVVLSFMKPAPFFDRIDIFSFGAWYTLSPNPRLIYVPRPNTGDFNSYGHRGKDYKFNNNSGKRYIFMGDSVVEGFEVKTHSRFTDLLDKKLGEAYEIINLAVKGYNLVQEFEYFKQLGLKFSPDYVFWEISYDDLEMRSGEIYDIDKILENNNKNSFYIYYYTIKNKFEDFLLEFNLYRHIKYILSRHVDRRFRKSVKYEVKRERAYDLLKEIKALSNKYNFKLVFVFLPVNTSINEEEMAALKLFIKSESIEFLDLDSYFSNTDNLEIKKNLFFYNDPCHFNINGHQIVADLLYSYVIKKNFNQDQL